VVKTASNATLGATVLVDAQGMTLYSLSGERSGKFICTSAARSPWAETLAEAERPPQPPIAAAAGDARLALAIAGITV
jgi:predicted lipoprotein with Yx(FWY)xxD motif